MCRPYGTRPIKSLYPALKRWTNLCRPTAWAGTQQPATVLSSAKGQQGYVARLLDGVSQPALMRSAHAGQTTRYDLPALRNKLREQAHILVVDSVDLLDTELASLLAPEKLASAFAGTARASGTWSGARSARTAFAPATIRARRRSVSGCS